MIEQREAQQPQPDENKMQAGGGENKTDGAKPEPKKKAKPNGHAGPAEAKADKPQPIKKAATGAKKPSSASVKAGQGKDAGKKWEPSTAKKKLTKVVKAAAQAKKAAKKAVKKVAAKAAKKAAPKKKSAVAKARPKQNAADAIYRAGSNLRIVFDRLAQGKPLSRAAMMKGVDAPWPHRIIGHLKARAAQFGEFRVWQNPDGTYQMKLLVPKSAVVKKAS